MVAHEGDGLQNGPFLGRQVAHAVLIERRDAVEEEMELTFDFGDGLVGDEFVEHERQARAAAGHAVDGKEAGA